MTMQSDLINSPIGDPNDPATSAALKRCFAYGANQNQGIGFREITGYAYPQPEAGIPPREITDDNGMARILVLNALDGKMHDVSTRVGPLNAGMEPARRDAEGKAIAISTVTLSGTSVVSITTAAAHGYTTGDQVVHRDILGSVEINHNYYTATSTGANTYTLDGTNSSNFTAYVSGGNSYLAGVAYEPDLELGEDVAAEESNLLRIQKAYVNTRPIDETNVGKKGYDANGYPDGLVLDANIHKDGALAAAASAEAITVPVSRLTFDRVIEANRLKLNLGANMGEFTITEIIKDYISSDIPAGPDALITSEQSYQDQFSTPQLWIASIEGYIRNRMLGEVIAIAGATAAAGPDGASDSSLAFSAAITLPGTVSLTGSGCLLIWYYGTINITIGGSAVSISDHTTAVNGWKLGYANSLTKSGVIIITPTGSARVADVRAFNSIISTNARKYLYNNVINNGGDIVQ